MEYSELPDAEKLKELRLEGQFPYSKLSVKCLTTAVILAATYFQFSSFSKLIEIIGDMIREPVTNFAAVKMEINQLVWLLTSIFCIYASAFLFSFILGVFIQSKFYFSLVNIAFNLTHVLKVSRISLKFFLVTIVQGIFGVLLGFVIGSLMLYWSARQFLGQIYSDNFFGERGINTATLMPVVKSFLTISIFILLILALISYFSARFIFLNKHRSRH